MIKNDLDILMLSMPVRTIDRPSMSLPVLTSHLLKKGFSVQQMDNNMLLQDILLDGKELKKIYKDILPMLIRMNQNCTKIYSKLMDFYVLLKKIDDSYGLDKIGSSKRDMQSRKYELLTDRLELQAVTDIFQISGNLAFYFTSVAYYYNFYKDNNVKETVTYEMDMLIEEIVQANPKIAAFSVMEVQRTFSIWAAKLLNMKFDGVICFGGSDLSLNKEKYLEENDFIDFVSWADGEDTLSRLIEMIHSGKNDYQTIPNLLYRNGSEMIMTEYEAYPLEKFDIPEYEGFPLDLYIFPALQLLTSKGCTWSKCKFCMHWNSYGQNFRQRMAEDVVDEIEYDMRKYNTRLFSIVDEAISAEYGLELSKEIIKRKLDIRWIQMSRLDTDFSEEVFQKMHQAGARFIEWGLESGSQNVLNDMCKGIDVKEVQRLIHESARAGIVNKMLMFHNYPTEGIDDIMKSINIIKKNTYMHLIKPMLTLRHSFVLKMGSPLSIIAFQNSDSQERAKLFKKVWKPESIYNVNAKYLPAKDTSMIKEKLVMDYLEEMKAYLKKTDVLITDNNNITMDLVLLDLLDKGYQLPVDAYIPRKQGGVGEYVLS
ncbi:B12-binding domain-containing radical SAM protein [Anaeromicropila populeti]|uniref:Radical SAM superfamily enzyme YgiQ, UPF0313 family n=1 Tax=Anaeromicropila populeti TaxID=37658 RepID=A0A1I6L0S3_9FIRM|nr:radical SAM protein [Anaeromicropila populeti]SFR97069.1 Radical SAM superfamily enzyme YgiQ, UPF0313 family [Anaeromicropila populeti]